MIADFTTVGMLEFEKFGFTSILIFLIMCSDKSTSMVDLMYIVEHYFHVFLNLHWSTS